MWLMLGWAFTGACLVPDAQPAAAASRCANGNVAPRAANLEAVERATVCLINEERRRRNLQKLRASSKLRIAGRSHADDMVKRGYFSHLTPAGLSPVDRVLRTGYVFRGRPLAIGEDLAWGDGGAGTARRTVRRWMHSRVHRANILSRSYRQIGVGVAVGSPGLDAGGATFAAELGHRG